MWEKIKVRQMGYKQLGLIIGPTLAIIVFVTLRLFNLSLEQCWTVAITSICAIWWIFEPIPVAATSLIPFAMFPFVGVLNYQQVSTAYGHHLILLLLAGFILSTAMEKSGVHRRLAIAMVRLFGGSGRKTLVLGFMLACAILSMWLSNTPTTLMLLPVAMAVLQHCSENEQQRLAPPLLLGIAYSASVGGIGTPLGTPPNLIFLAQYEEITGTPFSFLGWMKIGVPVVLIMIPVIWLWLTRHLKGKLTLSLPKLGCWTVAEKRVLILFAITALAWMTRLEPFGGWTRILGLTGVGDSTIALLMVIVMFLVPDDQGETLLNWDYVEKKIPWGLLILFSGGLAIANAFKASGLTESLGNLLSGLSNLDTLLMMTVICLLVTFMTQVTSNIATTTILMPILGAAALGTNREPTLLMIPAAISASCAFMLPVACAANAIVYSSQQFPISRMVQEGFVLNLIGTIIIVIICYSILAN